MDIAKVIIGCVAALVLLVLYVATSTVRAIRRTERAELAARGLEYGIVPKRGESNADLRWRIRMAAIYAERRQALERIEFLENGAQKPSPHPFDLQ